MNNNVKKKSNPQPGRNPELNQKNRDVSSSSSSTSTSSGRNRGADAAGHRTGPHGSGSNRVGGHGVTNSAGNDTKKLFFFY